MRLFHATPARNLASINRRGLLTSKSKGRLPVVWLHTSSRRDWATLHVMKRHGTREVVLFEVDVPRRWLTRSKAGLWYTSRDIPTSRLQRIIADNEE